MKNIVLIFQNSVLRNKLMTALSLAGAALICFMFYVVSTNDTAEIKSDTVVRVGLCGDCRHDGISGNLKNYFEEILGMKVVEKDYESLSRDLINKNISAIIEIPEGFYRGTAEGTLVKPEITVLGDYENAAFVEAYLNSYMRGISVISQAAGGDERRFSKMLQAQKLPGEVRFFDAASVGTKTSAREAYYVSLGFLAMIISAVTVLSSLQIMNDREYGTFSRMRCSLLKAPEYVIGVSLFGICCVTVMNLMFTVFAYVTNDSLVVPIGAALLSTELFGLFSVGISVVFGLIVQKPMMLMTVCIGYSCIGSMLGGVWFPVSDRLGTVGNISKLFPQYWLMDIFADGIVGDHIVNFCIIALAALLAFLIAAVLFTRKTNNNE